MRLLLIVLCCIAFVLPVQAQNVQKMSDAEQLGMMAGLASACGASQKLEDFELISSRLIANPAASEEIEKQQIRLYMQAKWDAMQRQQKNPPVSCQEVLEHFNQLPLFNSIVYRDGSVKFPDGTWSKPLRPLK